MNRLTAACCLLAAAATASADTVCRLASVGELAFGGYDILSTAPSDTLLGIVVTCERDGGPQRMTLTVSLGPGLHSTSPTTRRMQRTGGTDYLSYGLYQDVSRSRSFGSGTDAAVQTLNVPNNGSASATFAIYGRIGAQQDVSAGSYADRLQLTLTF